MKLQFTSTKLLFVLELMLCFQMRSYAQVTIGADIPANSGSLLDLKENENAGVNSTKGLLNSRVYLETAYELDPCIKLSDLQPNDKNIHIGLMVYNLTDSLEVDLCPGLHVWDGARWIRLPEPCAPAPVDPELLYSPNCYIVASGATFDSIPVAKPYLVSENRSDMQALDRNSKVSVNLLWQDTQSLIQKVGLLNDEDKGIYSFIKVETNTGYVGNALVAVHVGPTGDPDQDPIAWSWHIWVTNYDPDKNTNGTTYSHSNGERNYVFMDRNLGATSVSKTDPNSMGLVYQWGRKDPFTAAVSFQTNGYRSLYDIDNNLLKEDADPNLSTGIMHELAPTDKATNLEYSIKNPMTFYYGPIGGQTAAFDWYTPADDQNPGDNELWAASSAKSAFDPCPKGWRVPAYSSTKSPFAHFLSEEQGWALAPVSYVTTDPSGNGINLGANPPDVTELGFYAFGLLREPRENYNSPPVGGLSSTFPGGTFWILGDNWALNQGFYWTANASTTKANGKLGFINKEIMEFPNFDYIAEQELPRSVGASVRCVKVD